MGAGRDRRGLRSGRGRLLPRPAKLHATRPELRRLRCRHLLDSFTRRSFPQDRWPDISGQVTAAIFRRHRLQDAAHHVREQPDVSLVAVAAHLSTPTTPTSPATSEACLVSLPATIATSRREAREGCAHCDSRHVQLARLPPQSSAHSRRVPLRRGHFQGSPP